MVEELLKFAVFTVLPAAVLLMNILSSVYHVYDLGRKRYLILVLVLGVMLIDQTGEMAYFLETSAVRDPIIAEITETSANLITAGAVYYVLEFLRHERLLNENLQESHTELKTLNERLELMFEHINEGILLIDLDKEEVLEANSTAHELLEYDQETLEGSSPYHIQIPEREVEQGLSWVLQSDGGIITEKPNHRQGEETAGETAISAKQTKLNGTQLLLVTIKDNRLQEQYPT
jgi:PAS domain-containing protein